MALTVQERETWLREHIPHRVRACLAITSRLGTLLGGLPQWIVNSGAEKIARRCETDAIWEGRICSMRWLIEFVGLTEDKNGNPITRLKPKPSDFGIDDLRGTTISPASPEASILAKVWKGGTQGSSHPTHQSGHPIVNESELDAALKVIMDHLDKTIYANAPTKIAVLALQPPA